MPMKFRKILCPVDFSESSTRALRHALELGRAFEAEVILLHVVDAQFLSNYIATDVPNYLPGLDQLRENAEQELKDLFKRHKSEFPNVNMRMESVEGVPVMKIVETANREKADLICMGTHGRTGISHLLIGSVAEKVIRTAHCPVLVCKSPEQEYLDKSK